MDAAWLPHRFAVVLAAQLRDFELILRHMCYYWPMQTPSATPRRRGRRFCQSPFLAGMIWGPFPLWSQLLLLLYVLGSYLQYADIEGLLGPHKP